MTTEKNEGFPFQPGAAPEEVEEPTEAAAVEEPAQDPKPKKRPKKDSE